MTFPSWLPRGRLLDREGRVLAGEHACTFRVMLLSKRFQITLSDDHGRRDWRKTTERAIVQVPLPRMSKRNPLLDWRLMRIAAYHGVDAGAGFLYDRNAVRADLVMHGTLSSYNVAVPPRGGTSCLCTEKDEPSMRTRSHTLYEQFRDYNIPAFARHLKDFCDASRGPILERTGPIRRVKYRFVSPIRTLRPSRTADGLIAENFVLLRLPPSQSSFHCNCLPLFTRQGFSPSSSCHPAYPRRRREGLLCSVSGSPVSLRNARLPSGRRSRSDPLACLSALAWSEYGRRRQPG